MKNIIHNSFGKNFDSEFEKWFKNQTGYDFPLDSQKYFHLNQVHSDQIFHLKNHSQLSGMQETQGDAIFTDLENVFIAVKTADCAPILIFSENPKLIAAVHSGHAGSFLEITNKTIDKIINHNEKILRENLKASIGPSILQEDYEIGDEFYEKWMSQNPKNQKYFIKKADNSRFFFDNQLCVFDQLLESGIKKENIQISKINTFSDENFYSHRRKCLKTERNINLIGIF